MTGTKTIIVMEARLRRYVTDAGTRTGVPREQVPLLADALVGASLRGIDTHGVYRMPHYGRGFLAGLLNPAPRVQRVAGRGGLALLDGDNGIGVVVGQVAMDHAVGLAREHGVGAVAVRNSNHSGMLATHVLRACAAGCIGHFVSNAPAIMAPSGGVESVLSNGPLAWGLPTGTDQPIVLDMASSAAARSKIRLAARDGREIPADWAVGPDGVPTTDPLQALDGALLPMAGHKGSGLAIVNELLSSALPGARFAAEMPTGFIGATATTMDGWGAGHLAVAIDPAALQPLERFYGRVGDLVAAIKASGPGVMLPGEPEERRRREREADGVPLSPGVFDDLQTFAEEIGIDAL